MTIRFFSNFHIGFLMITITIIIYVFKTVKKHLTDQLQDEHGLNEMNNKKTNKKFRGKDLEVGCIMKVRDKNQRLGLSLLHDRTSIKV